MKNKFPPLELHLLINLNLNFINDLLKDVKKENSSEIITLTLFFHKANKRGKVIKSVVRNSNPILYLNGFEKEIR